MKDNRTNEEKKRPVIREDMVEAILDDRNQKDAL